VFALRSPRFQPKEINDSLKNDLTAVLNDLFATNFKRNQVMIVWEIVFGQNKPRKGINSQIFTI